MFRRRRFGDLIDRQLRVFAEDHSERLAQITQTRATYRDSDTNEAEQRYGDYADELEWAAEELMEMRDTYAATLDGAATERYLHEFRRTVEKALPAIASALDLPD